MQRILRLRTIFQIARPAVRPVSILLFKRFFLPFGLYWLAPSPPLMEAIPLNRDLFTKEILANRKDTFFLIIYKEVVDGGYGEKEALHAAKQLEALISKLGGGIKVYIISRPQITQIFRLLQRVKAFGKRDDDDSQSIEIFLKTPHSDDYVYFSFKRDSFYTPEKQEKLLHKIARFTQLVQEVESEDELNRVVLSTLYGFDSPLFLVASPPSNKHLKYFKNLAFHLLDRKWVGLNAKFVAVKNKALCTKMNLSEDEIKLLKNDIDQKFANCKIIDESIVPQLIEKRDDLYLTVPYISLAPFQSLYKNDDKQPIHEKLLLSIKQVIQPAIIFLRNSKKSSIGQFIMNTEQCKKNREKLILTLHIDPLKQHRRDYQLRIATFFKLREKYGDRFVYMISETNQLQQLIPHLNHFHANFSLFNIYNNLPMPLKGLDTVGHLYEKHFLKDPNSFIEQFEVLTQEIERIHTLPYQERLGSSHLLSYDHDRIQEIDLKGFEWLEQQHDLKKVYLYYTGDIMTDALIDVLKNLVVDKAMVFTMSTANQIPQLSVGENVLIINGTAIVIPTQKDIDLSELRRQIENLIAEHL